MGRASAGKYARKQPREAAFGSSQEWRMLPPERLGCLPKTMKLSHSGMDSEAGSAAGVAPDRGKKERAGCDALRYVTADPDPGLALRCGNEQKLERYSERFPNDGNDEHSQEKDTNDTGSSDPSLGGSLFKMH